ncbi:MAG: UbiA family prenyltransferase [Bacteroidetes bacterium]|nr:UbiA family prenyltransferase [Bacteroidota bacterium]
MKTVNKYLSLIKFSHTVFALPFAIIGFCLAIYSGKAEFSWGKLGLVLLCMVTARSAAMAFNRYIDRHFDSKNPRTAIREIPAGQIKASSALIFTINSSVLFMVSAYFINPLCFYLSPVALFVVLGYSYTKRFTPLCHLILGLGLGLAPIGAYLALTEQFDVLPILFSVLVFFWVGGFDIIFALQDEEFDRSQGLKSIPVLMGKAKALRLSEAMHVVSAVLVILAYNFGGFSWLYICGALVFIGLLIYQHLIVKPNDLSRVNLAFGTSNGIASVIFGVFVCLDIFLL